MAPPPALSVQTETSSADDRSADHDFSKGVKHLVDTAGDLKSVPREFILPVALRPLTVNEASIPVVDLYGLDGSDEQRARVVQAVRSACAEWGFFQIANHGIKDSLMEEMISAVEGFFSLPWEEKAKYASDNVMSPIRYGTSLNTPVAHVRHWRDYLRHYSHPIEKNFPLWPNNPPSYREVTKEYTAALWRLILDLAGAVSEGLGLERDYLEKFMGQGFQAIANNYYPKCPEPQLTLGLAAHSDHGCITILMDNGVEGLQVKHNDDWVPVRHVPGTFIVNLGDTIQILSNGRYKSVEHRAVANKERARISVAFGSGPKMDAVMAPVSKFVDEDGGPKYRPVVYKDYVKYQQTIVTRGKTALQMVIASPSD